jgi:hypothetical protein
MMSTKLRFSYLIAALILIVIGTILGVLAILYFYSSPTIYIVLHPIFQILGLAYFVIGVAIVLLPYFKSKKFEQISLALVLFTLLVFSFIFAILSILFQNASLIFRASMTLLSLFVLFYFFRFSLIKTNFPEADPLFLISAFSLLLSASLTWILGDHVFFDLRFLLLFLLGFIGSLIYAVETRMVAVRQTVNYKRITYLVAISQSISIIFLLLSLRFQEAFHISILLFFISVILATISLRIFETKRPLTIHKLSKNEKRIIYYNQICLIISYIWLFLGFLLFILNEISYDVFIHIISLGFIGNTIITFAPIFLPFILRKGSMQKAINFLIIPIYNAGVILRASIDLLNFSHFSALAGILIILSILIMVIRILSK